MKYVEVILNSREVMSRTEAGLDSVVLALASGAAAALFTMQEQIDRPTLFIDAGVAARDF